MAPVICLIGLLLPLLSGADELCLLQVDRDLLPAHSRRSIGKKVHPVKEDVLKKTCKHCNHMAMYEYIGSQPDGAELKLGCEKRSLKVLDTVSKSACSALANTASDEDKIKVGVVIAELLSRVFAVRHQYSSFATFWESMPLILGEVDVGDFSQHWRNVGLHAQPEVVQSFSGTDVSTKMTISAQQEESMVQFADADHSGTVSRQEALDFLHALDWLVSRLTPFVHAPKKFEGWGGKMDKWGEYWDCWVQ